MKYFLLIWAGLWRKKARTILTFASIVTAFFLFGMLQGINLGVDSLVSQFLDTSRLRISNRVNRNGVMPLAHATRIASVAGVQSITPLTALVGTYQDPKNVVVSLAVDVDSWFKIYPEFKLPADQRAAMNRTRDGALVGIAAAEKYGLKVGDKVPVQSFNVVNSDGSRNWEFTVVGIYDIDQARNFATNLLLNFDYVNEARGPGKNTAMQMIVRLTDPNRYATVAPAIDELFANSADQTMTQNEKDFIQSTMSQIGDINFFVNGIVGAVLFTLLFLTGNTMMQSVRERIPEIGVLKTLGFSNTTMLTLVLSESLILTILSAAVGIVAASVAFPALMDVLGSQVGLEGLRVPPIVFAWGGVLAVALAFASGFPPAWRAQRLKIVDALRAR
ncbi:MAG TPA: FtsX-like permease family protein [Steroidobacteraceae bacterium]|nr:FtsX-like permease family protein [Steroidobacteraceae bacterium]